MHRFYSPPDQCCGASVSLSGREAHHALHVMRVQRGEQIGVLDGVGSELVCEVTGCGRDTLTLRVVQRNSLAPLPCQITLLQAIPKGKLIEAIIQKATELGAARIVPLLSERVTTHLDDESSRHKTEKWRLVAIEAIKQCGAFWLPRVEPPITPAAFLARAEKFDVSLLACLQPGSRPARDYLRPLHERGPKPGNACVWVGPEGDFTPAETAAITAAGALPVSLGRLVLRSETAAVYCLSILNYELQTPRVEAVIP